MSDLIEPIIGWSLLVVVPLVICGAAWVTFRHHHRWRFVMVEDSTWPVHHGHTVRRCYCGATRPVDNSPA